MRNIYLLATIFLVACQQRNADKPKEIKLTTIDLVWSDEFNQDGLPDSTKWSFVEGDGCPNLCGWGNNELQYYTKRSSKNCRIYNGNLIIEATKEKLGASDYSSAKLITKDKGDWKYGRLEIRAKLPSGVGTWPAIWMLPTVESKYGGWPMCGEIDIMEHVGYNPDSIFGTIHTEAFNHMKGTQKEGSIEIKSSESDFHTYAIDWNEERIQWYVDSKMYHEFKNENKTFKEWPFNQRFYLILNIAVGGSWGGKQGVSDDIWPQKMEIDYVRVFQSSKE